MEQPDKSGKDEVAGADGESSSVEVFISYRVRPDEELAGELRTLLESAIEPRPKVFVSGLGGLRASAESYREQLRFAARSAKAYVGLITKASVDREWIFFEAGAAFGRSVLYAPVLVDVTPSELPSSIGGYQGAAASDQSRMRDFVEDVAKAIGGEIKPHFSQRFGRFAKAVETYGKPPKEDLAGVRLAIDLAETGRLEEAGRLFEQLEAGAVTPEEKANIRITKLVFTKKDGEDLFDLLEGQPPDLQRTAIFKLWLGVKDTNPVRAVQLLREACDGGLEGFQLRWALESLVQNEFQLGHNRAASTRLLGALSAPDRRLRAAAARQLALHLGESDSLLKLLLLVEATLDASFDHLLSITKFCWERGFIAVGLHVARRCLAVTAHADSHLYRGLLRGLAGLTSLEFADFRKAAQQGASVAKSNMASILNNGAVAEAGLEILREHSGDYSSSDPGSPYEIRALLERAVDAERKREGELCSYGDRVAKAIHRLFETWRRRPAGPRKNGGWTTRVGATWQLRSESHQLSITLDGVPLAVHELVPLEGFYAGLQGETVRLLVVFGVEAEAVALHGLVDVGALEWLELEGISEDQGEAGLTLPNAASSLALALRQDAPADETF